MIFYLVNILVIIKTQELNMIVENIIEIKTLFYDSLSYLTYSLASLIITPALKIIFGSTKRLNIFLTSIKD